MGFYTGGIVGAILAAGVTTAALAAPFCSVTRFGTNCAYFDVRSCQIAAASLGGGCVANAQPQSSYTAPSIVPQAVPQGWTSAIQQPYAAPQSRLEIQREVDQNAALQRNTRDAAEAAQRRQIIGQMVAEHRCAEARDTALAAGDFDLANA